MGEKETFQMLKELNNSILTGFQLATASGPLCDEPMSGVCFIIDEIVIRNGQLDNRGPFSGKYRRKTMRPPR